ncbi:MAG: fibronectin type III domain-containing protein [Clostridiales Family XIII bacterium]|jgi:hypothetical protein|nr:fibronectin type III domain-containing protein [Clostridiales Family XIII bacterium]
MESSYLRNRLLALVLVVALVLTTILALPQARAAAAETDSGDVDGVEVQSEAVDLSADEVAEEADGDDTAVDVQNISALDAPVIGSSHNYKIPDRDPVGTSGVATTLVSESTHFYIYFDDALKEEVEYTGFFPSGDTATDPASNLANRLETNVGPMFDQNSPLYCGVPFDFDGNGKVILLYTNLVGAVGEFYQVDMMNNGYGSSQGNQADMLYLGKTNALGEDPNAYLIVHEMQHLINYSYKNRVQMSGYAANSWLNEGISYFLSNLWVNTTQGTEELNSFYSLTRPASELFTTNEYGDGASNKFSYDQLNASSNALVNELGRQFIQHYWQYKGTRARPIANLSSDPRGGNAGSKETLGDNYLKNRGKTDLTHSFEKFLDDFVLYGAVDSGNYKAAQNQGVTWTKRFALGSVSAIPMPTATGTNFALKGGNTYRPDLKLFAKAGKDVTFKIKDNTTYDTSSYKNKFYLISSTANATTNDAWAAANRTYQELKPGTSYTVSDNTAGSYFAILAVGHEQEVDATITTVTPPHKISVTAAISKVHGNAAFSLGAKSSTGATLSYKSDATKVATVDSKGKVTIKGPGKATITVTAKATSGKYLAATAKSVIKVSPKKVTAKTLKSAATKSVTLTWTAVSTNSGYELLLATNSGFSKNKKTVTVAGGSAKSKKVTGLKKGTTYYVKVRAYKTIDSKKVYGAYSAAKHVKAK